MVIDLERVAGQSLFGFVRRLGLTDAEAEDAVQEVLVRLWSVLARGTTVADPRAWAFRSIYRLAMDEHRFRRRIAVLRTAIRDAMGSGPRGDPVDRIAVWAEVDRLPGRQRQVIYLRYQADLSFEQIGSILGITPSGARSHATQARDMLRHRLAAIDTEG